jgi:hypothetical protein
VTAHARGALAQIAGVVASELAIDLAAPLRGVSDRLGAAVDAIDRHVATSTGPAPYPYNTLGSLRQDLAAGYLEATASARRIDDLRGVLLTLDQAPTRIPVNEAVEVGIHLAGHRLGDAVELLVDLVPVPPALAERGALALVVARAVLLCAESATGVDVSTLSVRTRVDGDAVVIAISDNGRGTTSLTDAAAAMATVLDGWNATLDAAATDGQGCAFELRLCA